MNYFPENIQRETVGNRRNEGGLVKEGAKEQEEEQTVVLE